MQQAKALYYTTLPACRGQAAYKMADPESWPHGFLKETGDLSDWSGLEYWIDSLTVMRKQVFLGK